MITLAVTVLAALPDEKVGRRVRKLGADQQLSTYPSAQQS